MLSNSSYQRPHATELLSRVDKPALLARTQSEGGFRSPLGRGGDGDRDQERTRSRDAAGHGRLRGAYRPTRLLLVGGDGIAVDEFLSQPVEHWV